LKLFDLNPQDCGIQDRPPKTTGKQSSIKSFFTTKPCSKLPTSAHDSEGRFQFFHFETMDLLQVYVPNNGDRTEKWDRRREWDESIQDFLKSRRRIYQTAGVLEPMLLFCGDMNVARDYRDGSHWERRPDGSIYEFWTDETKCFVRPPKITDKHLDHVGIAGFTAAERRRFTQMLDVCGLCDVWRELHPEGVTADHHQSLWDGRNFTWRGHLSKDPARKSRYEGKGQRLDYFCISPLPMFGQVENCDILGYGRLREGLFCGSDHCAVSLTLRSVKPVNGSSDTTEE